MAKLIKDEISSSGVDLDEYAVRLVDGKFGDMKFETSNEEKNVYLTVLYVNAPSNGGLYAVATTTQLTDSVKVSIGGAGGPGLSGYKVASGTCDLDKDGNLNNITNIKLALTALYSIFASKGSIHFSNAYVNKIEGSAASDIIYIDSQGVDSIATLAFVQGGEDTIKFNGATTVQNIWGGGQGVHLL